MVALFKVLYLLIETFDGGFALVSSLVPGFARFDETIDRNELIDGTGYHTQSFSRAIRRLAEHLGYVQLLLGDHLGDVLATLRRRDLVKVDGIDQLHVPRLAAKVIPGFQLGPKRMVAGVFERVLEFFI